MYYCKNCHAEFENPEISYETHGLCSPPYEKLCLCPFCKSTDFKEIEVKYCHCCGARIYGSNNTYCNDSCRTTATRLAKREIKRKKKISENPLTVLMREVEKYNTLHHTKYSYGQYVAIIMPKLSEDENAKEKTVSEKISTNAKANCPSERDDSSQPQKQG